METVKNLVRRVRGTAELEERVSALEDDIQECRQVNVRLAELCDVMMELLLPAADRDDAEVERILARYRTDIGDPTKWRGGEA